MTCVKGTRGVETDLSLGGNTVHQRDLTWSESKTRLAGRECTSAVVDLVTRSAMEALFFNVRVLHALDPLEHLSDAGPYIYRPMQGFSKAS